MIYKIIKVLEEEYNIISKEVNQQIGGWASLAYQILSNKEKFYFLKVYKKNRASTLKWTSLIDDYIPIVIWLENTVLKDKIIKPIKTITNKNKIEDEDNVYILFEYIEGYTVGGNKLTYKQIEELSVIISKLHSIKRDDIPFSLEKIKENFDIPFSAQLSKFLKEGIYSCQEELKKTVQPYVGKLKNIIQNLEALSGELSSEKLIFVLCHTDIHNWNIMQTKDNFILLDWEGLKFAPAEADLFGLINESYFDQFFITYKEYNQKYEINIKSMKFYLTRRKIEDIWEFIEQFIYDDNDSEQKIEIIENLNKELNNLNF